MVVASHWHDDHIGGLSEVVRAAECAKFVNSAAYEIQELRRLAGVGVKRPLCSATREYNAIIEIIAGRPARGERKLAAGPTLALANKKLLARTDPERAVAAEIFALSPSDGVFNLAKAELNAALSVVQDMRRPPRQGPNRLCVVLWLRLGHMNVLLGADLENVVGTTEGWKAIIASPERPEGLACLFKVPHHGSNNADCPECWTDLLTGEPFAILTSYSPANLPAQADINRIRGRTSQAFLTSDPKGGGVPRRDNAVEKTLRGMVGGNRRAVTGQMGHIRIRADARTMNAVPTVSLRNGAFRL